MCDACGCSEPKTPNNVKIEISKKVLSRNDKYAEKNREFFKENKILVINLISSPGSGKTTLLQTISKFFLTSMAVIVGDEQTSRDADRIKACGVQAFQIQTRGSCHLDALEISHALNHLEFDGVEILIIENVGNLVCPASYDLGENLKTAILSLPEGDDKVLKYPSIFSRISNLVINKTDLKPYLDFNVDKAVNECRSLSSSLDVFNVSGKTGEGVEEYCDYLKEKRSKVFRLS